MTEWGWNPATFQAIGGIASALAVIGLIVTIIFTVRSTKAAIRAAAAAARDTELRTRPWVALKGITYRSETGTPDGDSDKVLRIKYHNVGALPALGLRMQLTLYRVDNESELEPQDMSLGGVFPNEPSVRRIYFREDNQLFAWAAGRLTVGIRGKFSYVYGDRSYVTEFQGKMDFSSDSENTGVDWSNTLAQ